MGTILLFHTDFIKTNQILKLCAQLGHKVLLVKKEDYAKPLGSILGLPGMESKAVYKGAELPHDMMVFFGMDEKTLNGFLQAYRSAGIAPIPRKAVLTPSNAKWTVKHLYEELDEHAIMR